MAGEKTIATLVGKLRFEADYKPLLAFEKRLDAVNAKMQTTMQLAKNRIALKVKLDTKSLAENLKVARQTKLVLNNLGVSKEALSATMSQIEKKLGTARISIGDIKIPMKSLVAQKKLMRDLLESTTIDLPLDIKLRAAEKALRTWKKTTEEKFKLYLQADISKQKFYRNVKQSVDFVTGKIGAIKLQAPQLQLTVDRAALRTEIANVLKTIEREAKIKIQLQGNVGGGGGRSTGGRESFRQTATMGGVAGAAAHWGRGFIPGLGGAFAVSHLNTINQEMQAQQLAMQAVMGSKEAGAQQQAWVEGLSDKIGLDFRQVTPAFTKMLASGQSAGMSTESVQNIFQGVSEFGRTMGLDTDAMKGSMRAIEQMMNKNQVMSEELKGQLAERMPGVISAMAEAAGFGTGDDAAQKLFKAMENGDVKSKDVLEEFAKILAKRAREGGALGEAMLSTMAQQARFNNEFSRAVKKFSEGGFDKAIAQFFGLSAESMKNAGPMIKALGNAFEILMKPVNAIIILLGRLGASFGKLGEGLGLTEGGLIAMSLAALANLTPLGRMLTLFSSLVLAGEDFMVFLDGGNSKFGEWFNNLSPEKQQQMRDFGNAVVGLAESIGKIASMVWEGWSGIFGYFEESGAGWGVLDLITSLAEGINDLVNALERMKNGDFSDLAPDTSTIPKIGASFNSAVDRFLPGTPLQDATRFMNSQLPSSRNARMAAEQQERLKNYESSRGSGADVPKVEQHMKLEVNVKTDNPQAMESALQEGFDKLLSQARQAMLETIV